MKLTDAKVRNAKPAATRYRLADGRGLTLNVFPHAAKLWWFRFRFAGKEQTLALGAYPEITLAAAREAALEARRQLLAGQNPCELRSREKRASASTLGAFAAQWAADYITKHSLSDATVTMLKRVLGYIVGKLGKDAALAGITQQQVHQAVLAVAGENGNSSAARSLRYLRDCLGEAVGQGMLAANPAADVSFDAGRAVAANGRKGITEPKALGELLRAMAAFDGKEVIKLGLQLLALVYTRPSELLAAQWSEFDLDSEQPQWTIPAERMKLRREHLVPLSRQAVAILRRLHELTGGMGKAVLTLNGGTQPDAKTFLNALERIGYKGRHDAHGFRVTASTLLHEQGYHSDAIELSLAHAVGGVKGKYNRAHLLPQRRELAQAWADYLDKLTDTTE